MAPPSSAGPLRIVFAGTPDFAASSLAALLTSPHQIVGVYTQPDRPAGRGRKVAASPVKQLAEQHNIPVFQPLSLKNHAEQKTLQALNADVMVVVAYGLILPPLALTIPKLGCINVHASLLPRWRGAAPIQRAVLAGDEESGVTIMQMDAGLDSGDMLLKKSCPIKADDTGSSLHDRLAELGAQCLLEALQDLPALQQQAIVQDHDAANYARKLNKAQACIDWQQSAEEIERLVRAFNSISPLSRPASICINVHASLLPRWRGAAPIQRAVLAGDEESGVTIMQMDAGLDSGDMLLKKSCPIKADDTGSSLHDRLAELGAQCLLEALQDLPALQQQAIVQDHDAANYARKLNKAQACIDWQQSAEEIERLVRAFNSWPVAYSKLDGTRVRIWQAKACDKIHDTEPGTILHSTPQDIAVSCGSGVLKLEIVQLPGAKALPVSAVLNAKQDVFTAGKQFT